MKTITLSIESQYHNVPLVNAAIYFRKPILVNRYQIFEADIEPKGFKVISFDGFITYETVQQVKQILNDSNQLAQMAETNCMAGWRYLSFEMLEEKFEALLANFYGT
jgi:hypothetical protein